MFILTQPTPALTPVYLTSRRGVDTEDGSLASDAQLSHCDMFRYPRLGTETRPSVDSSVTLPTNPAPSYDSGVGYTNGTLHFGDRDGTCMRVCMCVCVCMYVCMYGWMDGWADGRMDGMDGWMGVSICKGWHQRLIHLLNWDGLHFWNQNSLV